MANVKISQLPLTGSANADSFFVVVTNTGATGTNKIYFSSITDQISYTLSGFMGNNSATTFSASTSAFTFNTVNVSVRDSLNNREVYPDITFPDQNKVRFQFSFAPSNNSYYYIITGKKA